MHYDTDTPSLGPYKLRVMFKLNKETLKANQKAFVYARDPEGNILQLRIWRQIK